GVGSRVVLGADVPVVDLACERSQAADVVGLVFEMLKHRAERKALGEPVGGARFHALVLAARGRGAEQGIQRLEVVVLLVSYRGIDRPVLVGDTSREELRLESSILGHPGRGRAKRRIGGAVGKARRYPAPCYSRVAASSHAARNWSRPARRWCRRCFR